MQSQVAPVNPGSRRCTPRGSELRTHPGGSLRHPAKSGSQSLRTGRSSPAAPHPASRRRSCSRLHTEHVHMERTCTARTKCARRRTRGARPRARSPQGDGRLCLPLVPIRRFPGSALTRLGGGGPPHLQNVLCIPRLERRPASGAGRVAGATGSGSALARLGGGGPPHLQNAWSIPRLERRPASGAERMAVATDSGSALPRLGGGGPPHLTFRASVR